MVKKVNLLFVASLVWLTAGLILLMRGLTGIYTQPDSVFLKLSISLPAGVIFYIFIFRKIVHKHTKRILTLEGESQRIYRFFNQRSYLLMFSMIALGISVRISGIIPMQYLTTFYIVMGIPLFLSGLQFIFIRFTIK